MPRRTCGRKNHFSKQHDEGWSWKDGLGPQVYQSFYKGTCFPVAPELSAKRWEELKSSWEDALVLGIRLGKTIPQMTERYKTQLDLMENVLNDWGRTQADGVVRMNDALKTHFVNQIRGQTQLGLDGWSADDDEALNEIQNIWYYDVYALIRLKVIKDDDLNGWLICSREIREMMNRGAGA